MNVIIVRIRGNPHSSGASSTANRTTGKHFLSQNYSCYFLRKEWEHTSAAPIPCIHKLLTILRTLLLSSFILHKQLAYNREVFPVSCYICKHSQKHDWELFHLNTIFDVETLLPSNSFETIRTVYFPSTAALVIKIVVSIAGSTWRKSMFLPGPGTFRHRRLMTSCCFQPEALLVS